MSIRYKGKELDIFLYGHSVGIQGMRDNWTKLSDPEKHFNIILGKKSSNINNWKKEVR